MEKIMCIADRYVVRSAVDLSLVTSLRTFLRSLEDSHTIRLACMLSI